MVNRPGEKRLVAYIVASQTKRPAANELRGTLEAKLPDYTWYRQPLCCWMSCR